MFLYISRHSIPIELIEAIFTHSNAPIRRFSDVFTQFQHTMDPNPALQAIAAALQSIATVLPTIPTASVQPRPSDLSPGQTQAQAQAQAQTQAQTQAQAQCISAS